MTFLPIVERELRVAARRGGTYWGRLGAALAAILMTSWVVFTQLQNAPTARIGQSAFRILSLMIFFTGLAGVVRQTADALSKEKREGTLGFLFLTDLKGYDIIFGKLAATTLGAFYQFLAVLPVLAVPLLLGGVTAVDFGRLALALANVMFYTAAIGLFASTLSRREARAASATTFTLLLLLAGLPGASFIWQSFGGSGALTEGLRLASPTSACLQVLEPGLFRAGSFWGCLAMTHGTGWIVLGLACWALPRTWQDRPAGVKKLRWRERWRGWLQGDARRRTAFRTRHLDRNPISWLTNRDVAARWSPWIFITLILGLIIGSAVKWEWPVLSCPFVLSIIWVVHAICKMSVVAQAARGFSTDRDQGSLELLLSTPLTEPELVRGQWLTLRRLYLAPTLVLLALETGWMAAALPTWDDPGTSAWLWAMLFVAQWLMFGADMVAGGWLGLWKGVTERNATQAASGTQMRIMVLPWILTMVTMAGVGILGSGRYAGEITLALWFTFGALVDVAYGRSARRQLHTELRAAAARRFSGDPKDYPAWRRFGRWAGRACRDLFRPAPPGPATPAKEG